MKRKIGYMIVVVAIAVTIISTIPIKRDFNVVAKPMIEMLEIDEADITFLDMTDSLRALVGSDLIGLTSASYDSTYTVWITRDSEQYTIDEIIAHELIHVYQSYSGRVVPIGGGMFIWNGYSIINSIIVPYELLPWEIEAREYSKILLNRISNKTKLIK